MEKDRSALQLQNPQIQSLACESLYFQKMDLQIVDLPDFPARGVEFFGFKKRGEYILLPSHPSLLGRFINTFMILHPKMEFQKKNNGKWTLN